MQFQQNIYKNYDGTYLEHISDFKDKALKPIDSSIEYWIGYALGYIQGHSNLSFDEIFKKFPLENWYKMYILHEVGDDVLWDKTLARYLKEKF